MSGEKDDDKDDNETQHRDGYVEGNNDDNLIDDAYVGDPDGDMIDAGDDIVLAGDGDDTVKTGEGNDWVYGGGGSDSVEGGAGNDVIYGDSDLPGTRDDDKDDDHHGDDDDDHDDDHDDEYNDTLGGGEPGNDTLVGGSGNDHIWGEQGDDSLFGNAGNDQIRGGSGDDIIDGGDGNDQLRGDSGDDTLVSGSGNNVLRGDDDADIFKGFDSTANNVVFGGAGGNDDDTLDLTGTAGDGSFELHNIRDDSDGNGYDGIVRYFDDDGKKTGQVVFKNIENIVPCFTPGTVIATPQGERLVEDLKVGDRVITRDNGLQKIRWIGTKSLSGVEMKRLPHLKPVLIKRGALGNDLPERDMMVSPNHRVLITNERTTLFFEDREMLAAAKHLVGSEGFHDVDALSTSYIHFMFDHHEVVLSNGAWTESFQPGDMSLKGLEDDQRNELFDLFPELANEAGIRDYRAARRSLKKHEARLLVK